MKELELLGERNVRRKALCLQETTFASLCSKSSFFFRMLRAFTSASQR